MLSLRFDELRFVPLSLDETDEQWERGKDDRFNCLPMPKKRLILWDSNVAGVRGFLSS